MDEYELMVEPAGSCELRPQRQLPFEDFQRPSAKDDLAIVASLRSILVATEDARPDDPDFPFHHVAIADP